MFRFYCAAIAAAFLLTAPAVAQTADVTGWWRAELQHNGQSTPIYLHFDADAAHARARFSIPVVRMHEVNAGPYEIADGEVRLPGLGWALTMRNDALDGVLPSGLVSVYEIAAHFVRAEPPTPPAPLAPLQAPPQPAWTADVGAAVWAGLVHDRGRNVLYVADDDGKLTALNAQNGERLWHADLGAPIRATPTLHSRRLYVASDAAVIALDARNGAQIWSASFGAEKSARLPLTDPNSNWDHYSASVAIDGDFIAVGARDGCLYALFARTGARRWRTCTDAIITSTPAISRDAVFFGGFDNAAHALSRATGAELWRHDARAAIPRDAVMAGDNVLFGSRSYDLIALDARTGAPAWTRYWWFSWIDSPPAMSRGVAYVGSSDALAVQAFDPRTGDAIWSSPLPGWSWARPGIAEDTIYAAVAGGPYIDRRAGGFAAIDRASGALRWLLPVARPTEPRVYGFAAAPAVAGRRVFAADLAGKIYAFDDPRR